MSIANLITTGSKSYQDIDVNTLTCQDCTCITNTIDELYTQNIYADPPANEIDCHNTFNMLGNDLINVGTLQATNIIGDIADDIIDVNQINPKDNPDISITGDLDLNNNDITNVSGIETNIVQYSAVAPNNNIKYCATNHLFRDDVGTTTQLETSNTSVRIYSPLLDLNSGDITEVDDINLNSISTSGLQINVNNDIDMNGNILDEAFIIKTLRIESTTSAPTKNIKYCADGQIFRDSTGLTNQLELTNNYFRIYTPILNLNNNDIVNVKDITFQTTPLNDDTEDRLLVLNTADDKIEYRNASSLGGSIYDQSLNIGDDVQFGDVALDSISKDGVGDITLNNNLVASPAIDITCGEMTPWVGLFCDDLHARTSVITVNDDLQHLGDCIIQGTLGGRLRLFTPATDDTLTEICVRAVDGEIKTRQLYNNVVESLGQSTNAGGWVNKVTLTDTFVAGDYEVEFCCLVANSNNDEITELRLQEDAVTLDGVSIDKPKVNTVAPPRKFVSMSNKYIRTLTGASHTFTLDFQPRGGSGTTAYIRDARIIVKSFY